MTAFFFSPGSDVLFTLLGLGMIIWLIGAGAKSAFGGLLDSAPPKGELIHVKNARSANGKLVVKNAKFTDYDGFYSADIVDAETGEHVCLVASKDRKEFEDYLESQLDWWSRNPIYKKE